METVLILSFIDLFDDRWIMAVALAATVASEFIVNVNSALKIFLILVIATENLLPF